MINLQHYITVALYYMILYSICILNNITYYRLTPHVHVCFQKLTVSSLILPCFVKLSWDDCVFVEKVVINNSAINAD